MTDRPRGLRPGDPVPVRFEKWGGLPHWAVDVLWLGEDDHGWWLGWPEATVWTRPGRTFRSDGLQVGLFPRDRGFAATFYQQVADVTFRIYADVATRPSWRDGALTAVDLDLDVLQGFDGTISVDDEDEFAEHRLSYGYPADVVAAAEAECACLVEEMSTGAAHFAEELAQRWRAERARLLSG
jgi:protein associated with RNAse G/E